MTDWPRIMTRKAVIQAVSRRSMRIPHIPIKLKSTKIRYRTPPAPPITLTKYELEVKIAKPAKPMSSNNPPRSFRCPFSGTVDSRNPTRRLSPLEKLMTSEPITRPRKTPSRMNRLSHGTLSRTTIFNCLVTSIRFPRAINAKMEREKNIKRQNVEAEGCFMYGDSTALMPAQTSPNFEQRAMDARPSLSPRDRPPHRHSGRWCPAPACASRGSPP